MASSRYPLNMDGPLCAVLADEQFLFDAYVNTGFRQLIKGFCKRNWWEGKPKVSVSVGETMLRSLLVSLFNSAEGRKRLDESAEKAKRKGKDFAPPLCQAIWAWLPEVNLPLAEKFKNACQERSGGLYFLSPLSVDEMLAELAASKPEPEVILQAARMTLGFCMLQPAEREDLVERFLKHFPHMREDMGA